jgi:hypothetical protein
VYVGVTVIVTPVGKVDCETVGVTITVGDTDSVLDRVTGGESDGVVDVVSVFVGWVVVVNVRVGREDRVMTGLREPETEVVDVLVVAPEAVIVADVVEVLELEVEPVVVVLAVLLFDGRADREAAFVRVGFAVVDVVDVVVGVSVCWRLELTVRVVVTERRGVVVVVFVWTGLGAAAPVTVRVVDEVVVLDTDAEAVLVAVSWRVWVVFSDPE